MEISRYRSQHSGPTHTCISSCMKHGKNMKGKVNRMKKLEKITLWTAVECYWDDHTKCLGVTALDQLIPALESATTPCELQLLDYDAEEYELVKKDEKGKRNE